MMTKVFGFLAALGIVLPFVGQSVPFGGRLLSIAALAAAMAVFLLPSIAKQRPSLLSVALILSAVVLAVVVTASASPIQLQLLLKPSSWRGSSGPYYDSKLVMFVVSFAPALALAMLFAFVAQVKEAAVGWIAGLSAVAIICFVVLLSNWQYIARTDFWTSLDWFAGKNRTSFSTVSYGLAFTFAGISALGLVGGRDPKSFLLAAFSGVLLFGVFWLNRRGDVLLYCVALVGMGAALAVFRRKTTALLIPSTSAIVAALLAFALGNGSNWTYWTLLSTAFQNRLALALGEDIRLEPSISLAGEAAGSLPPPAFSSEAAQAVVVSSEANWLSGQGLGSFAFENPLLYPHNVLIELTQESGVIAAACYLAVAAIVFVSAIRALLSRRLTLLGTSLTATAGVAYAGTLKTGDISSIGFVVALAAVAATYLGSRRT